MGEAVLRDVASKRGIDVVVDSAGTAGYHVGEDPDERCVVFAHLRICSLTRKQKHYINMSQTQGCD
jgi:protein-tyrosine-phosphatase